MLAGTAGVIPQKAPTTCCPRSPGALVHPLTHRVRPAPCKSWACEHCAAQKREAWINELHTRTSAERFFCLTLAPRSSRGVWLALKHFTQDVRRHSYTWEYFATISRNPRGTGAHIHGLQTGDFVPLKRLKIYAARNGFGEQADIQSIERIGGVAGYVTKHLVRRDLQIDPDLKGTRRVRYSRHFFTSPRAEPTEEWTFLRVPPDFAEDAAAAIGQQYAAHHELDGWSISDAAASLIERIDPRDITHFATVAEALGARLPSYLLLGRARRKTWGGSRITLDDLIAAQESP